MIGMRSSFPQFPASGLYKSKIESQDLGSDIDQLTVSLYGTLTCYRNHSRKTTLTGQIPLFHALGFLLLPSVPAPANSFSVSKFSSKYFQKRGRFLKEFGLS
jgi:hypothetical protein